MRYFLMFLVLILTFARQVDPLAAEDKRVALVIGNASFTDAIQLDNPINDANLIANKLTDLGFQVHLVRDASFSAFTEALRAFERDLQSASTGMFYFAGHGMQFREENYLLSTDARIIDQQDVVTSGKNLNAIIRMMEAHVPLSLVFIDACRNNPFADNLRKKLAGRARALGFVYIQDSLLPIFLIQADGCMEVSMDGSSGIE